MYFRIAAVPPDTYEIVALRWNPEKEALPLRWPLGRWVLTLLIGLGGVVLLIFAAFPVSKPEDGYIQGWVYLVVNVAVAVSGLLYWVCFLNCSKGERTLMRLGNATPRIAKHGDNSTETFRQCSLCCSQTYRSQAHRHLTYGYINYLSVEHTRGFWLADLLYWFFGGQDRTGNPRSLAQSIQRWWFEK